ncbi:hypothetical protein [Mycobacterium sp. C31M]
MQAVIATVDPASRSAASWSSTLAGLKSAGVPNTDPRVIEAQAAGAYWRVRRILDQERGNLSAAHIPALADLLRHAHPAVPA